ncbi:hypothetical protein N7481_001629 [Penicillium waksmanii]|uniref:uncharacterized protein n=1 Tax=Penicillium waksmanii TaxID=69791 RepID=UPI0025486D56|nr:uncharacterized protein N7481_001629 [Penicillium waksmanii]KAJ6001220.1 hypothetical protein N7481_001629 [Penicillium waksmanii]
MTSKSTEENSRARELEDGAQRGRTRRETLMAREATVVVNDGSDDEEYQPSNDEDRRQQPEDTATSVIDAFDYVSSNHPLRPARAVCVLDRAQQLARFRNHFEFWWDVLLTMGKQAKMNTSRVTDQTLRGDVLRLGEENRELRRERDRMTVQRDMAEKRLEEMASRLDATYQEHSRHPSTLAQIHSTRHETPMLTREHLGRDTERDISHVPSSFCTASLDRFDNPKFPDAPVFSGDRKAFDSCKDKVHDKLSNSAAQSDADPIPPEKTRSPRCD